MTEACWMSTPFSQLSAAQCEHVREYWRSQMVRPCILGLRMTDAVLRAKLPHPPLHKAAYYHGSQSVDGRPY
jgi:hypothetical protein